MRWMVGWIAIVVACGWVQKADAQFLDGNKLHETCASENDVNKHMCTMYIYGAFDTMTLHKIMSEMIQADIYDNLKNNSNTNAGVFLNKYHQMLNSFRTFCVRQGVTGNQLRDVVVKYSKDNPAERDLLATVIVSRALESAFPCPQ